MCTKYELNLTYLFRYYVDITKYSQYLTPRSVPMLFMYGAADKSKSKSQRMVQLQSTVGLVLHKNWYQLSIVLFLLEYKKNKIGSDWYMWLHLQMI